MISASRNDSTRAACSPPLPPGGRKKLAGTRTSSAIGVQPSRAHRSAVVGQASAPLQDRRKTLLASSRLPGESVRTRQVTKLAGPPSLRKMLPVTLMMLDGSVEYRFKLMVQRSVPRSLLTM